MEIVMGDALVIKKDSGEVMKIWLSSIRPPKSEEGGKENQTPGRQFRPLYDIPHMFDAREFLRKRLIGKKVTVTVDYVQPKSDSFPEKTACTVLIGQQNVAEALVS
uniref:TNase-like domain-containing protein n=1 Tax=Plectus sambesii TaxID=2011161 RepID=A0A914VEV9_9BILA